MPNTFTLTSQVASLAAAQLYAATPVYRLTARADLVDELMGITPVNNSVTVLVPDEGNSSLLPEGGTTTATDLAEGSVTLSMDNHFYDLKSYHAVDAAFRVKRTLADAVMQAFGGSIRKIAEDVDAACLDAAKVIPYWVGSPGTAIDTKAKAVAGIPVITNNRGWTGPPVAVFSADDYNTVSAVDAFSNVNTRGSAATMATGLIGNVWGVDWVSSRAVNQPTSNYSLAHVAGTLTAGAPLVNGAVSAGATTMNVDGGVGTETLKVGDLFTVAGVTGQFSVVPNTASGDYTAATETYTATAGAITGVAFYPAAPAGGFADNAAITFLGSHTKNFMFTPGCLASAVIPPLNVATLTGNPGMMESIFDADSGIGLALTLYDRNSLKLGNEMSIDTFHGAVLVRPERGVVYVS